MARDPSGGPPEVAARPKYKYLQSHEGISTPAQRVGLCLIWRAQKVPGGVRSVTRDHSFLDAACDGLAFYPDGLIAWSAASRFG